MTATTTREARTAALRKARERASHDKRQQALAAIDTLAAAGTPITFASVAKTAGVSSWLVHADGIREHVQTARRRQADNDHSAVVSYPHTHRRFSARCSVTMTVGSGTSKTCRDEDPTSTASSRARSQSRHRTGR